VPVTAYVSIAPTLDNDDRMVRLTPDKLPPSPRTERLGINLRSPSPTYLSSSIYMYRGRQNISSPREGGTYLQLYRDISIQ
jgi:hypothetical protein